MLLDACANEGSIRHGLNPDDVLLLMGFMWRTAQDADGKRQARRIMELAIDGLRAQTT